MNGMHVVRSGRVHDLEQPHLEQCVHTINLLYSILYRRAGSTDNLTHDLRMFQADIDVLHCSKPRPKRLAEVTGLH
jgi:hypothetical protein